MQAYRFLREWDVEQWQHAIKPVKCVHCCRMAETVRMAYVHVERDTLVNHLKIIDLLLLWRMLMAACGSRSLPRRPFCFGNFLVFSFCLSVCLSVCLSFFALPHCVLAYLLTYSSRSSLGQTPSNFAMWLRAIEGTFTFKICCPKTSKFCCDFVQGALKWRTCKCNTWNWRHK